MTPQDFVDQLNYRAMRELGYELVADGELLFWEWPFDGTRYPADERTRKGKK